MAKTKEARIRARSIKSDYEQNKQTLTGKQRFAKFYNSFFKNMSSIRQILLWYLIISISGALLLWAPISHTASFNEVHGKFGLSFIDAMFVSASAFSDTGLSTVGISDTFNFFGQLVTLILLSIGGVGWFTIKIFLLQYILRRKTTYKTISDAASEVGTHRKNETLGLIFSAVVISLSATIIFGFIFSFIFCYTEPNSLIWSMQGGALKVAESEDLGLYHNYGESLWTGLYHASTSVNNSGLDIFAGDNSLAVYYQGANGISIQVLTIMLFVVGGIGFGVFYDIWLWVKFSTAGRKFTFSLITKISIITYAIVAFAGLGLAYLFEGIEYATDSTNSFIGNSIEAGADTGAAWWSITFNTFSTRNAGFSTTQIGEMAFSTQILYGFMMFIGSGPGSTAGGLRTTTVAVLIIAAWSDIRGRSTYQVMNRNIPRDIIKQAIAIFVASLVLVAIWILVIGVTEAFNPNNDSQNFVDDVFVVFSAYGTTGLSTTSLSDYHWFSKVMLIILMFLGQLGMSTTLSQFKSKTIKHQREFIEETINLG